jgi:hypothetical protein
MLAVFPMFQPEELFYGAVARYAAMMDYRNPRHVLQDVFGAGHGSAIVDLPTRLGDFVRQCRPRDDYDVDELIDRHTCLPYYSRFIEPEKLGRIRSMMSGDPKVSLHFTVGLAVSAVTQPRRLRFCRECAKEDAMRTGEAFWRRLHQLPGVLICPVHKRALFEVSDGSSAATPRKFVSLDEQVVSRSQQMRVPRHTRPLLVRLGESSQWLLQNAGSPPGLAEVRRRIQRLLGVAGWERSPGAIRLNELSAALRRHATDELLGSFGCSLPSSSAQRSWLAELCQVPERRRRFDHPLRYLLVLDLLGLKPDALFSVRADEMPQPPTALSRKPDGGRRQLRAPHEGLCANVVCPAVSEDPRHSELMRTLPVAAYEVSCEHCAFVYYWNPAHPRQWKILCTDPQWEALLRQMAGSRSTAFSQIAAHFRVSMRTVQRHIVKLGAARANWRPYRGLVSKGHGGRRRRATMKHRDAWLSARKAHPNCGRSQLRDLVKGSYNHLVKHDRDWLHKNSPPVRAIVGRPDGFWAGKDEKMVRLAKEAVARLLKSEVRPPRICVSRIRIAIGRPILKVDRQRLPRLAEYLDQVCESDIDFARRRLAWAVKEFRAKRTVPSRTALLKRMGLRPEKSLSIAPAIERAIKDCRK